MQACIGQTFVCSLIVHIKYTHIHAFATGYSVVSMSFQMYCHCVYSDLNANVTLCQTTAFSSAFFAGLMGVRTCNLNCYRNYSFAHIAQGSVRVLHCTWLHVR